MCIRDRSKICVMLFVENIMLHHPRREGKFVIYSDASDYAVESVLYQQDATGEHRVIAYASRIFKGAVKHYSTSEKEILAIVSVSYTHLDVYKRQV